MNGIVIGGGIVGLTTALTLHREGIKVRVFDQVRELREVGVGLNLLPHSVKHLWSLGLQEALDENGVRTGELRFFCKSGKAIWREPRGTDAGYEVPQYSIHRGRLQGLLLAAVKERLGDVVVSDRRLVSFEGNAGGVSAVLENSAGETFTETADFLIGADGINSRVRQQFYPEEGEPKFAGLMLWRGATRAPGFLTGRTMFMAGHNEQKVVVYPISGPDADGRQLINWVAEFRVPMDTIRKDDWHGEGSLPEFADRFRDWRFGDLVMTDLFTGADAIYKFPMVDRDPLPQWSFGRVTLAGDAAHAMYPNGSNGASQGVLDAVSLAAALGEHDDPAAALKAYEVARREPTSKLILDNRKSGPERVLQYVEERCDGQCGATHECVPAAELEEVATAYKRLAGFDKSTVNEAPGAG